MGTAMLAVVCCGIYPVLVYGLGRAFADKADGSIIFDEKGVVRGSKLIGQNFTAAKYFHPRPSSAGNGYDATSSGGSNLGPANKELREDVENRAKKYRELNDLSPDTAVPIDAVTSSGSGLDPHISPANADLQVARVARTRHLDMEAVHQLVAEHTDSRQFWFLGEPRVNVLTLNLALDQRAAAPR